MDSKTPRLFGTIILFCISILLPFALPAEEQTGGVPAVDDRCTYVFRSCEADGRSPEEWKECVRTKQPDCIAPISGEEREYGEYEREYPEYPKEYPKEEYQYERKYEKEEWREHQSEEKWENMDGDKWGKEREWEEEDRTGGDEYEEKYDEGSDKEQWLNKPRDRMPLLSKEDQLCAKEVLNAKENRCAVSSVPDCVAKTAHKTLVQEGKCGFGESDSVEMDNMGDRDFGGKMGSKTDMGMGMGNMMREQKTDGPHEAGPLFGQAVGIFISLTGRGDLPADVKADVNAALAWFSEKVGAIAGGANAEEFLPDAKAKLEDILRKIGGGFGGGPDPARMREEVDRVLENFRGMLSTIPKAMARMSELFDERGKEVKFGDEWKSLLSTLEEDLAGIEAKCAGADSQEAFRTCFESFREFPPRMGSLKNLVEGIVRLRSNIPMETMQEVMEKVHGELFREFEMGHNSMEQGNTMRPPGGMQFEDRNIQTMPPTMMPPSMGPGAGPRPQMMEPPKWENMPPPPMPFQQNDVPFNGTQSEFSPPQFIEPQTQESDVGRNLRYYQEWEGGGE